MNRRNLFKTILAGSVVSIPCLTATASNKDIRKSKSISHDLTSEDRTERIQALLQCYDKGFVSAQTILEELDLDCEAEFKKVAVERMRTCGVNI